MRPLELTLEGVPPIARRPVRLARPAPRRRRRTDRRGQSRILEAIAFALYGKTPTFERDTKSLINQTASECHVELGFEVEAVRCGARRGARRKGRPATSCSASAPTAGRRRARADRRREAGPRAGRAAARNGLRAFCRSVLLAQNRFADFLKATPRERNEVLKGVFGYERFDGALEAAKRRVTAAQLLLESLDREGSQLGRRARSSRSPSSASRRRRRGPPRSRPSGSRTSGRPRPPARRRHARARRKSRASPARGGRGIAPDPRGDRTRSPRRRASPRRPSSRRKRPSTRPRPPVPTPRRPTPPSRSASGTRWRSRRS